MDPNFLQKVEQRKGSMPLEIVDDSWLRITMFLQCRPGLHVTQSAPEEFLYLGG